MLCPMAQRLQSRHWLTSRVKLLSAQRHSTPRRLSSSPSVGARRGANFIQYVATATAALSLGIITYRAMDKPQSMAERRMVLDPKRLPSPEYGSLKDMESAVEEIRSTLRDNDVITTNSADVEAHGYSESSYVNIDTLPVAVAYPHNTEQVSTIARICNKWRVPLVPYSGGTSVEAHTGAPFGGICIDFEHMSEIIAINEGDMDVIVQPGVNWTELNEDLGSRGCGLFFPIDPAPSARIGGMIGTNCSGTNAVRYGTMRNWVLNVTMVLADGTVIKTRRRPRKSSAGYDLTGLVVGSEGTLGIVTEATLKLAVVPQQYSVAVVPFPDIETAVSAATAVIRNGVPVAALELMDEVQMRMVNQSGVTSPRTWKESATLFFKFSGTPGTVKDNIETVKTITKSFNPASFEFAESVEEQAALWAARKESLYSILSMRKPGQAVWGTDVAVPLSCLTDIVKASKAEGKQAGLQVSVKGHVGDSNFHENILYDKTNPEECTKAAGLVKSMVNRAIEMEGTCTGEHGIGLGKKDGLLKEVGEDVVTLMKLVKRTFDPHWIMNPGKIFDC